MHKSYWKFNNIVTKWHNYCCLWSEQFFEERGKVNIGHSRRCCLPGPSKIKVLVRTTMMSIIVFEMKFPCEFVCSSLKMKLKSPSAENLIWIFHHIDCSQSLELEQGDYARVSKESGKFGQAEDQNSKNPPQPFMK